MFACVYVFRNVFVRKNPMKSMELFFLSPFAEEIHAQNLNRCVCVCVCLRGCCINFSDGIVFSFSCFFAVR